MIFPAINDSGLFLFLISNNLNEYNDNIYNSIYHFNIFVVAD